MTISSKHLDELQRLSDACGPVGWVSLVEGRDIESGSSFIQVNEGRGPIGDIELTLVPGQDSPFELHRVGHEVYVQYQDLIAAARTNLPSLIAEIRRLQEEVEYYKNQAS
jgi:predicted nucleic acid-binding OB-fold protein